MEEKTKLTRTEAIEDEWAVVNVAPKKGFSWSDVYSKSQIYC